MIGDVKGKVIDEASHGLGRAPGSSEEPIHVRSEHGAGVIQGEQGIEPQFFQLPLSCVGASSALSSDMCGMGVVPFQMRRVVGILV